PPTRGPPKAFPGSRLQPALAVCSAILRARMSRKNIENVYGLSPMQQGILFHALYDHQPGVYLVELAWTLTGKLDREAFQRAWQEVCDRHAILRTAFVWERVEKPMQVVRRRVPLL